MSIEDIFDLNEIESNSKVRHVLPFGNDHFTVYFRNGTVADVWIAEEGFGVAFADEVVPRRFLSSVQSAETKDQVYELLSKERY